MSSVAAAAPPPTAAPMFADAAGPSAPTQRLIILADRCKGCELCVTACATHVLALDRSRVNALGYNPVEAVDISACTSCALCARVCPDCVFTVLAPRAAHRPASGGGAGS